MINFSWDNIAFGMQLTNNGVLILHPRVSKSTFLLNMDGYAITIALIGRFILLVFVCYMFYTSFKYLINWCNRWLNFICNKHVLMLFPILWHEDSALSAMEGIIDLHHEILFFLIFVVVGVVWMLWTILVYFTVENVAYWNNQPKVLVKKDPAVADILYFEYQMFRYFHGETAACILKWVLKIVGGLVCFFLYLYFFEEPVKAAGHTPMPKPIEPDLGFVTERTRCFNTFCSNIAKILSTKDIRVTAKVCEDLFTYLANNPDHGRAMSNDPRLSKAFFTFVITHGSKYVVLKPLAHTSLHTVASELPHLVLWYEKTGEVFFKVKNESILKGVDFVSPDGTICVQAKTIFGTKATINHVNGVISNVSRHTGTNAVSILVDKAEIANDTNVKKFVYKPPHNVDNVIVSSVEEFPVRQANWFCNSLAQRYHPEAYDRITALLSEQTWGNMTLSDKSNVKDAVGDITKTNSNKPTDLKKGN